MSASPAGGVLGAPAFADDHALLAAVELDLFELSADPLWLARARAHLDTLERDFRAPSGGYYRTAAAHEKLFARELVDHDGVVPCATSVAAESALRLAELTSDESYRSRGEAALGALAETLRRAPQALGRGLLALDFLRDTPREIAVALPAGMSPADPAARALTRELATHFVPNRVLVVADDARLKALADGSAGAGVSLPWLEGKHALGGKPTAFVCEHGRCELPTSDPSELARLLDKRPPGPVPPGPP